VIYLRRKLIIGQIEPEREVVRGEECLFIMPVALTSKWLPAWIRITAYYGYSDKSIAIQSRMVDLDLCAGDRGDVHFSVVSRHTGILSLDEAIIEVKSLFGLFKFKKRYLNDIQAMQALVLPRTDKMEETSLRALDQVDENRREYLRINERSDQVETMRAYTDGDDARSMHWPVSSKLSALIVKQFEAPISAKTHILFDDYTGYSLETDEEACDRALDHRDQILDSVTASIHWLLSKQMSAQLHLGLSHSTREWLHGSQDHMRYRRILASLTPDSLPTLAEMLSGHIRFATNDRYLLFSRRLSETSANSLIHLSQNTCQVIFFYFKPEETSREEDHALRMIRQSSVEVVEMRLVSPDKKAVTGEGDPDV
ncbi:MAG TPA: DUF58 domain-containing protein, partial [Clostridia bacterium]|nr:DUF58 domain-containing protein [Clostridia bacterium]